MKKFILLLSTGIFMLSCAKQTANIPELRESGYRVAGIVNPYKDYVNGDSLQQILNDQSGLLIQPYSRDNTLLPHRGIPAEWKNCSREILEEKAHPGEFFVFKTALLSRDELMDIEMQLIAADGSEAFTEFLCFNTDGVDYLGNRFSKTLKVEADKLTVLLAGFQIPENAKGSQTAEIKILSNRKEIGSYKLKINVNGEAVEDSGVNSEKKLSRLKWLNSRIGFSDKPVDPYIPVEVNNNVISILGRKVHLRQNGLPSKIESYYNQSNTEIIKEATQITGQFEFKVSNNNNKIIKPLTVIKENDCRATWIAEYSSENIMFKVTGVIEYDGYMNIDITAEALETTSVENMKLVIPFNNYSMKYSMGIDQKSGALKSGTYDWKWDTEKHQDAAWIGNVNGGVCIRLKGANFKRPLVNAYYQYSKLNLPDSWGNENKGGITLTNTDSEKTFTAYCGERTLEKGKQLHFITDCYITPFKTIDTDRQWKERYLHITPGGAAGEMPDINKAEKYGANILNIHHNRVINPFINYPYNDLTINEATDFINKAHSKNMRVKFYYTTREITTSMAEFFPLYWLDGEIIHNKPEGTSWPVTNTSGPHPVLNDLLRKNFIPAWREELRGKFTGLADLAVITTPDSRWNNFYLEGLNFMLQKTGFDGIYIDDTALDRTSLQRARNILKAGNPDALIDTHSWNHYNQYAGYSNCAIVFMELFPYYDKLWLGEAFDYENNTADYILVENSGLPFGTMSEMLQNGGNIWRGMLYGMTNRKGWHGPRNSEPQNIWKLWDNFGMEGTEMIGYWDSRNPVKTGNSEIKATVYKGNGKALIAFAGWNKKTSYINPEIDWAALGIDKDKAQINFPYIKTFQLGLDLPSKIKIPATKGRIMIITSE
jgi:hypothetical protein